MLFQRESKIAASIYKDWAKQAINSNNMEYGEFWGRYWNNNKEIFCDPEFYLSFFDHERWNVKEFCDHNNPFYIKYSKGNYQAQINLFRTISILTQTILSGFFKNNFEACPMLLDLFSALNSNFPLIFPGDPQYPVYYDDTRIKMHQRFKDKRIVTTMFGNRDVHNFYSFALCHFTLNKTLEYNDKKRSIVEIGGGYGGLCCLNLLHNKEIEYVLVDLPEASCIQLFVLLSIQDILGCDIEVLLEEEKWIKFPLNEKSEPTLKRVRIVPSNLFHSTEIQNIHTEVDAVLNFKSMMEMPPSELNKYFNFINQMPINSYFIATNRYTKISNLVDYPLSDFWQFEYSYPHVIMAWHHDFVLKKINSDTERFQDFYKQRINMYHEIWKKYNGIPPAEGFMINNLFS
ncbi:hypothetical protein Syncc9902_0070 [Synechococcus sp. CC9902]|uniref:hypothetical protein n=1 Tax=Synechococcus sp. (strain CC9902) TaxID=316279 RepID=UPI00005D3CDF|nr:hypothetical protein [Synechococcus sp. CC9902]ABB25045.1 hypothetical protein Syncc9902_0070 [Synechococcus sp. CC9902]